MKNTREATENEIPPKVEMSPKAQIPPKELVMSFIKALNAEDFAAARKCTQENMKFVGVMGSRNGAEAYFKDMKNMKLKYKIRKSFEQDNDVCLLYDIDMDGQTIFSAGLYQVVDGMITSIRVVFDPRPIL